MNVIRYTFISLIIPDKIAERPRQTLCQPKRLVGKHCIPSSKRRKKAVKDDNLYEIEIKEVDRERNLVRIHYKGYSAKFDGPYGSDDGYFPFIRQENMLVMSEDFLNDRADNLKNKPYREIKRKLFSCKRDDPIVPIEVDAVEAHDSEQTDQCCLCERTNRSQICPRSGGRRKLAMNRLRNTCLRGVCNCNRENISIVSSLLLKYYTSNNASHSSSLFILDIS